MKEPVMKEDLVKDILIKLQFLSEREFQEIEAEIEKLRRLRQLLMENQQQLPLFFDNRNKNNRFV